VNIRISREHREHELPFAERVGRCTHSLILSLILLGLGPSSAAAQLARSARQTSLDLKSTVQIDEIDPASRIHLERVQQFLDASQWSEAVTALRRVMDNAGENLIAVTDAGDRPLVRYIPVRRYCQWLLSRWHETAPHALAQYRREVDEVARRWYEEAVERHDESQLREVARHFFVSSSGDDALMRLGEYALERGDYPMARLYWEQVSPQLRSRPERRPNDGGNSSEFAPLPAGRPRWLAWRRVDLFEESLSRADSENGGKSPSRNSTSWLAYPDSSIPLPDVQARLAFVSILEGHWERAEVEISLLRREDSEAVGTISGRQGRYVDLLEELLREARDWQVPGYADEVTFGSTGQRIPTHSAESNAPHHQEALDVAGPPLWRVSLPRVNAERDLLGQRRLRAGETSRECLSYHPIVVGSALLVSQADGVRAFDVATGRPLVDLDSVGESDEGEYHALRRGSLYESGTPPPDVLLGRGRHWGVPRFTLTESEGRLFARLGTPITRWRNLESPLRETRSFLVGLDLSAEGRLLPGFPLLSDNQQWAFEGVPLVRGNHLWVAMRKQDAVRVESHLACFEVPSGRLVWRTQVCTAETPGEGLINELSHSLVTLAHDTLYFNTHLGVVCALDARSGDVRWLVTYPRAVYPPRSPDDAALHHFRDLTPAAVWRGTVLFAPSDSRRMFAVEGATGQLLWSLPEDVCADAKHILGVSENHWIVSGDYLYWIDAFRGELVTQFPPPRRQAPGYAAGIPRGYGRGMLHGERIYWPTQEKIFVFRRQPGGQVGNRYPVLARAPIDLRLHEAESGNLVAAHGILLIATADEVLALRAGGYHEPSE
jgi:hypothetical protein